MANDKLAGFSLLELMVSLFLAAILMLGLASLYLSIAKEYRLTQSLARQQEQGRFIVNYLRHQIRMAGYYGCAVGKEFSHYHAVGGETGFNNDVLILQKCMHYQGGEKVRTVRFDVRHKTLYQSVGEGRRDALIDSVESFKIRYGVSNNAGAIDGYVSADEVVNWSLVKSVLVKLLCHHHLWIAYTALREV